MVLNYDIVVDLTPEFNKQLSPKFSVSLGDHGSREYMAKILQSGEPYEIAENSLVSIVGKKPDGHIFAYDCTYSDEYVYFTIEEQMTPVSGIVACELVIIDTDGHKLGSANFTFWVEPCPVSDGEASESDLQMFQEILDAADDLADVREILDRAVPIAEQIGDIDKLLAAFPTESASGELITLTDGADGIPAKKLTLSLAPHQSGSGDPSPDNVRSISGYQSVKVYRAGKNLIQNIKHQATINAVYLGQSGAQYALNLPKGTYTISVEFLNGAYAGAYYHFASDSGNRNIWSSTSGLTTASFVIDKDEPFRIWLYTSSGISADDIGEFMIEVGDTATAYEPYTAQEYDIAIPTSAGTVYGGQLTVNDDGSGTLTVDRGYIKPTSIRRIDTHAGTGLKFWQVTDNAGGVNTTTSTRNLFLSNTFRSLTGIAEGNFYLTGVGQILVVVPYAAQQSIDNINDAGAWLASVGAEFVYPLAEPQTYTLTAEQVTTLLGDNTVWMDADGTIDLAYRADTEAVLDGKQDTLTFDATPTADSLNPVTSGGIYDAMCEDLLALNSDQRAIIPDGTDINTLTTPGNFRVTSAAHAATMINAPISNAGYALIVLEHTIADRLMQIAILNTSSGVNSKIRIRLYNGSTWTDWRELATEDYIKQIALCPSHISLTAANYRQYLPNGSFNDAPINSTIWIPDTITLSDAPEGDEWIGYGSHTSRGNVQGTLLTYRGFETNSTAYQGLTQLFIGYRGSGFTPTLSHRIAIRDGSNYVWSAWSKFTENGFLHSGNTVISAGMMSLSVTDLDNMPQNVIWQIDRNLTGVTADATLGHHPAPGKSCVIVDMAFSTSTPHGRVQTVYVIDGRVYWRYGYQQSADEYVWKEWVRLDTYLPDPPAQDGTYTLRCTVANGVATYSWV